MDACLYINDTRSTAIRVRSLTRSYTRPWEAELYLPDRHDADPTPALYDEVVITDCGGDSTTTTTEGAIVGRVLFRGNIVQRRPGGIAGEGIVFIAAGRRFALQNEPVRVNGRSHYMWNRRGFTCNSASGEDSPGCDGLKWTAGEIVIDILEHALGIPGGGSDISGHHSAATTVTDTYLDAADVAGYTAADWTALDSMIGEFSVDNTSVADALDMLLGLNGGFYGWYIDPDGANLVLVNLDTCPVTNLAAGELGHWQDEGGKDYVLLDNHLDWSLDGVCSRIVIQGTDATTEERPANIEGSANATLGDGGELELVAAPWLGYGACYRSVAHAKRLPTLRPVDAAGAYTPPDGWVSWVNNGPRVYQGTDAGAKAIYNPGAPNRHPIWNRVTGMIMFVNAPALGPAVKLWGWYFARIPFEGAAGPDGDAFWWYGYDRTRYVYDTAFKSTTSYPVAGTADDLAAMRVLARRLLRLYKGVRRQGRLVCDVADVDAYGIDQRYAVTNLTANSDTPALPITTTTTQIPGNPAEWSTLNINAVEVVYDFEQGRTTLTVANTFWMLEEYSELKRRLEQNLFAKRELDLSEDINECQTVAASFEFDEDEDGTRDTTTTTPAPPSTTTPCDCPNTLGSTDETEAAATDTWDITEGCITVTMQTRTVYNHGGDKKLYAYYRDFTYNAAGRLLRISAETRVEIDPAEPC